MSAQIDAAWVRALPKAEVHVHLDGCIDKDELVRLAAKYEVPLRRPVERLFEFDGLTDFLQFLDWGAALVQTPDDAASVAYKFAERQKASGIRHTDVIINPTHWAAWRGNLDGLVDALDAGWRAAEQDGMPTVGLCVSLLRQQSAQDAAELVDWMVARPHSRVVGISIDGDEAVAGRVSARFADAFRTAADRGILRTVHAGESSGPEGVRDALDLLMANRIDHGIRAIEDSALVAELADRQVPLGVCPGSNVSLGFVESRENHPVEAFREAGVRFSLNTDDGTALGSTLDHEYIATAHAFGWGRAELVTVARTSIESAFCNPDQRRSLLADLDAVAYGEEDVA
jgi:adenosine deaminase